MMVMIKNNKPKMGLEVILGAPNPKDKPLSKYAADDGDDAGSSDDSGDLSDDDVSEAVQAFRDAESGGTPEEFLEAFGMMVKLCKEYE